MTLTDIITEKIARCGPISFKEYMDICLYYPELGYYTSVRNQIGVNGDYYTSTTLSSAFGTLIGKQLEEMWRIMDEEPFMIVEYGAGTGTLCRDILAYLHNNEKMYAALKYCIIEKSPSMRYIEQQHLLEKVSWHNSIDEVGPVNGCILSNELLDNFPVHQVVMLNELMEVFVGYDNGFIEILKPASEELKDYLSDLSVELLEGFRTEINLQAVNWITEIAAALKRGFVMTIDYGYPSSEFYKPCRSRGTLLCYHKHSINDLPYENIGEQDITTHVNFSALQQWGHKSGLTDCGFTDQCHFLLSLGLNDHIQRTLSSETDIVAAAKKASFLSHTLLIDMGTKFKVLIQSKGLPQVLLSGLKYKAYAEIPAGQTSSLVPGI